MLKKLIITMLSLSSLTFAADKIEVDASSSKIVFNAKKLTATHTGEVKLASGFLNFAKDTLVGGEFMADMTTISNTDITDADYHKKFIDHMISEDFFGVEKFKTAKFVFKSAKKLKNDNYKITGNLTIKDVTAPVTFEAVVTKEKASAKLTFDRTKYGIKYGSGKFFQNLGDKLIADDVELVITLTAKK